MALGHELFLLRYRYTFFKACIHFIWNDFLPFRSFLYRNRNRNPFFSLYYFRESTVTRPYHRGGISPSPCGTLFVVHCAAPSPQPGRPSAAESGPFAWQLFVTCRLPKRCLCLDMYAYNNMCELCMFVFVCVYVRACVFKVCVNVYI